MAHMKDWSDEKIFQFLDLFERESCLWDRRKATHKSLTARDVAWNRILQNLPFNTTLDEVKRKKDSLVNYYRIHLKKHLQSVENGGEIFHSNWFAFDKLNSFLKPIYAAKATIAEETREPSPEEEDIETYVIKVEANSDTEAEDTVHVIVRETEKRTVGSSQNSPIAKRRKTEDIEPNGNDKKSSKAVEKGSPSIHHHHPKEPLSKGTLKPNLDEYDHFGFMIASKIRKIDIETEREILMNTIQNLAFKTLMKNRDK